MNSAPPEITAKTADPVRYFITSGSDKEKVPDKSIFRKYFIRALEDGAADKFPQDGFVTGEELGVYLKGTVYGESEHTQTPQHDRIMDFDLNRGDFVFALPKKERPGQSSPTPNTSTPEPNEPTSVVFTHFTLRLSKIITQWDGSVGDTRWTFKVTLNEIPLNIKERRYDDDRGKEITDLNLLGIKNSLDFFAGNNIPVKLKITGDRIGSNGNFHAEGELGLSKAYMDSLAQTGKEIEIEVKNKSPKEGQFYFYFTLSKAK